MCVVVLKGAAPTLSILTRLSHGRRRYEEGLLKGSKGREYIACRTRRTGAQYNVRKTVHEVEVDILRRSLGNRGRQMSRRRDALPEVDLVVARCGSEIVKRYKSSVRASRSQVKVTYSVANRGSI